MAFRIQLRNDTLANWSEVNPILLQGEPAYENNSNRLKIGNGASGYNELPYFYGNIESVNGLTGSVTITGGTGISIDSTDQIRISSTRTYEIYTCNLNSSGTDNPTQIILENEIVSVIDWVRGSTGVYLGTLSGPTGSTGAFGNSASRVSIMSSSSKMNSIVYPQYVDEGTIQITQVGLTGDNLDGLDQCFVEIKIY